MSLFEHVLPPFQFHKGTIKTYRNRSVWSDETISIP